MKELKSCLWYAINYVRMGIKKILHGIRYRYSCYIECLPYINWFNILATLYLNFRSFPFRQAVRLPVFVYGHPKLFSLYGSMICKGRCYAGMVRFNQTNANAPSGSGTNSGIANWGQIVFKGRCQIYTANKINVSKGGVLEIGDNTKIMHFCNISAYNKVSIGDHTWITHRCQVMDTKFHFIADFNRHRVNAIAKPIFIGAYCWICNSTTVFGGSIIPDRTIVASNSLVNKDMSSIPDSSIVGGIPAKVLSTGYRRIDNINLIRMLQSFFKSHPNESYFSLAQDVSNEDCNYTIS